MKLLTLLSVCFILGLYTEGLSQFTYSTTKVELNDVPSPVMKNFNDRFKDIRLVQWEKHTAEGAQRNFDKYVVIFDQEGIRSRARYRPDGTGISASSYYLFKRLERLPSPVREYAKVNYPDHILGSGEKIQSLKSSQFAYRIRLRKGSSRIVVYLNEKGEMLKAGSLPSELTEDEDIDNG